MAVRKVFIDVPGVSLDEDEDEDDWTLKELLATNTICEIKAENITNYHSDVSNNYSSDASDAAGFKDNALRNGDVKTEDPHGSCSSISSNIDPLQDEKDNVEKDAISQRCRSRYRTVPKSLLPAVKVLKTARGNEVYDIEGHTFRFNSLGDNGAINVKCSMSHRSGCAGRASIKKTGGKVAVVDLNRVHSHKGTAARIGQKKSCRKTRPDVIPNERDFYSSDDSDAQPTHPVRVLKTSEELDEYYVNGYVYQCNSIRPDDLIYSMCSEARLRSCTGRAKLRKDRRGRVSLVRVTGFHNHPPEFREEGTTGEDDCECTLLSVCKQGVAESFGSNGAEVASRLAPNENVCYTLQKTANKYRKTATTLNNETHDSNVYCIDGFSYSGCDVNNKDGVMRVSCAVDGCGGSASVQLKDGVIVAAEEGAAHNHAADVNGLPNGGSKFKSDCSEDDGCNNGVSVRTVRKKSVLKNHKSRRKLNSHSESVSDTGSNDRNDTGFRERNDPGAEILVKVLKTSKGNDEYLIEGHIFQRSSTKYGKTYVQCRSYRTGCKARGILKIGDGAVGVVQVSKVHSHGPDTAVAIRTEAIGLMMQKFKDSPESTPLSIYKEVMNESFDGTDAETKKGLPSYKNVSYILNRAAAKYRKIANCPSDVRKRKRPKQTSQVENCENTSPVKVLRTSRRKDEYLINGYIFHCGNVGKRGSIYVQCKNYSHKECSARGVIRPRDGEALMAVTSGAHNHPADVAEIVRSEAVGMMVEKYKQYPELSPSTIYDMVIKESYDATDPEVLKTLPTLKNVIYILRRTGAKLRKNGAGRPVWRRRTKPEKIQDSKSLLKKDLNLNTTDSVIPIVEDSLKHSIKVLQTSKGSDEYFIDGYIYQLSRTTKLGKVYLHCKNYRRNGCWGRGIVKVDGADVTVVQISDTHNHEPDTTAAIRAEALGLMIQTLKDQPDLSTLAVYNRVMSKSFDVTDAAVASAIPSYNNVSSILRKASVRIRGHPPNRRVNRRRNANVTEEQNPAQQTHSALQTNLVLETNSLRTVDDSKTLVKVLQTSKGKDEYFFDGYIYQLSRRKDCSSMYLQCKNYRRNGCSARGEVKWDTGVVTLVRKSGVHNHGVEIPAAIRAEALRMMINKLTENPESSPSSVYNHVMKESFDTTDVMVRTAVPSYKSVSSILQKTSARLRRSMPNCPGLTVKRKRTKKNEKSSKKDTAEHSPREDNFDLAPLLSHESDPYNMEMDSNLEHDSFMGIDSNHESVHGPRLDAIPPLETLSEANSVLEPDSIQKYIIWKVSD